MSNVGRRRWDHHIVYCADISHIRLNIISDHDGHMEFCIAAAKIIFESQRGQTNGHPRSVGSTKEQYVEPMRELENRRMVRIRQAKVPELLELFASPSGRVRVTIIGNTRVKATD